MDLNQILGLLNPKKVMNIRNIEIAGFAADSREIGPDYLFAAVRLSEAATEMEKVWYLLTDAKDGFYFDHHPYIEDAIENGAKIILCEVLPDQTHDHIVYIKVDNVISALGRLASKYVSDMDKKVIAVTGSWGKTTTVHMIYTLLRDYLDIEKINVYRTTPITLPLGILNSKSQWLVMEMPTDHKGCISQLCQIVAPDIAVITGVADAYINVFGSKRQILSAMLEVVTGLNKAGTVIINLADEHLRVNGLSLPPEGRAIGYGDKDEVQFVVQRYNGISFELKYRGKIINVDLPLVGLPMSSLFLAATKVAELFSLEPSQVELALDFFKPPKGHMSWMDLYEGRVRILDCTSKSNPVNLRNIVTGVRNANWPGKRVLLIGDIDSPEHPEISDSLWRDIESYFELILLYGNLGHYYESIHSYTPAGFRGMDKVIICPDKQSAIEMLELIFATWDEVYLLAVGNRVSKVDQVLKSL